MRKLFMVCSIFFLTACQFSPGSDQRPVITITISAASSMSGSLMQLKKLFESEHHKIELNFNFGGSGTLRKQIENGAPIDMFISASQADYDQLVKKQLITDGKKILQNQLVIIKHYQVPTQSFSEFLSSNKKIAIGTPYAVPSGTYAKEILENFGVWEQLEHRLVYTKDVHQVVTLVETKAVPIGIVYASDVLHNENIAVLEEISPELHSEINYFLSIIKHEKLSAEKREAISSLYNFLLSESSMSIFRKHGFIIVNE